MSSKIAAGSSSDKFLISQSIKHEFMLHIATYNEVECYINGEEVGHEGYVLHNEFGSYKIVDREVFSRANFLIQRPRSAHQVISIVTTLPLMLTNTSVIITLEIHSVRRKLRCIIVT